MVRRKWLALENFSVTEHGNDDIFGFYIRQRIIGVHCYR
jgi:hypothetical protein